MTRHGTAALKLSKAIATIGFTVKSGTGENKNAHLYQRHCQFLEDFLEKLRV